MSFNEPAFQSTIIRMAKDNLFSLQDTLEQELDRLIDQSTDGVKTEILRRKLKIIHKETARRNCVR